jgi:hypothetical protein
MGFDNSWKVWLIANLLFMYLFAVLVEGFEPFLEFILDNIV